MDIGLDKSSKGTVVKYHPISKIEADHLMILPVGTKVSIHGLKTRTELNDTVGYITEIDLSKQRYLVNLLTDGSCISVKFENVAVYEESKADNLLEGSAMVKCVILGQWVADHCKNLF